jgi:hypothetical protein
MPRGPGSTRHWSHEPSRAERNRGVVRSSPSPDCAPKATEGRQGFPAVFLYALSLVAAFTHDPLRYYAAATPAFYLSLLYLEPLHELYR